MQAEGGACAPESRPEPVAIVTLQVFWLLCFWSCIACSPSYPFLCGFQLRLCVLVMLSPQAKLEAASSSATAASVTVAAVLEALGPLGLQEHCEPVAGHLIDNGYEELVPLSGLVKLLRDAGLPPTRALAVKSAVLQSQDRQVVASAVMVGITMHDCCHCTFVRRDY
jgi:hypothetical protein